MEKYVIKRNGEYKPLESYKIKDAISKSFKSVSVAFDESVFENIILELQTKEIWAVEEIQDLIEKSLFKNPRTHLRVSFFPINKYYWHLSYLKA